MLWAVTGERRIPGHKPVYPVAGQVTLNGKPVPDAQIVFHPLTDDAAGFPERPVARAGANGQFVLTTYSASDGAPAGRYAVTVELYRAVRTRDGDFVPGPNVLPPRYSRPATSGLQVEVKAGTNNLPPLEIKR